LVILVVIAFTKDQCFGLTDKGQRGLRRNTSVGSDREAMSSSPPSTYSFLCLVKKSQICVPKSLRLNPTLSQMNPIYALTLYFVKGHYNIVIRGLKARIVELEEMAIGNSSINKFP
jgi:hypothetical protein